MQFTPRADGLEDRFLLSGGSNLVGGGDNTGFFTGAIAPQSGGVLQFGTFASGNNFNHSFNIPSMME